MLTKIKIGIGVAVSALIAFLYFMLRIEKAEKETAQEQVANLKNTVTENEKTIEVSNEINKAKDVGHTASNNDIDGMLSQYDRDKE